MFRIARVFALACGAWIVATALPAEAQWVTLARKAVGKVKELTQSEKTGAPGYSIATVLVKGQGEKVYQAALKAIQSNQRLRLTKSDSAKLTLEFADGQQVVGMQVTQVGEDITQILIASTTTPGKPDETSVVAAAALRICRDTGTECSLAKQEPTSQGTPAPVSQPTPPR